MNELMYSKIKNVYVKDSWHNEKVPLNVVITVEQTYCNNERVSYLSLFIPQPTVCSLFSY